MYGLIMENLSQYIGTFYGELKWDEIRRLAKVDHATFSTHHVYPDNLIPKLTAKACKILGVSEKEFLENMGKYFVSFLTQYGYDRVLSVLGRHMRDFLNGLDNLHEYLKFSYPRMKPPSFFCENESTTGLVLHYRSTRRGFLWYTIGQIKVVGSHFYETEVKIDVLKEETVFDSLHVTMQLSFDNRAFQMEDSGKKTAKVEKFMLPVKSQIFLEVFPFCIVFDQSLVIKTVGNSMKIILPDIVNRKMLDIFDINRPLIECTWKAIQSHTNNIFELSSVEPIIKDETKDKNSNSPDPWSKYQNDDDSDDIRDEDKLLHLKGQMMFMEEWKCMVYLGTPVMRDLDAMLFTGLYINDLSMHDFSRDMVLAGQQQSAELKLALDQELSKSKQLEDSMKKLDVEMRRTDELLYQMIPKAVADRLRKGDSSVSTCQYFDSVTILFSDVVTFTEICSRISPMQVVSMLNAMYSLFDQLTEKHGIYKVETIGDAYMVVAGAPDEEAKHAEKMCQMAIDMVTVIGDLKDPSTDQSLRIRVGLHSGTVVAGVVGLKMPRYCLFGDTVNTASRMESTSEALRIHVSEKTVELLVANEWEVEERGTIDVKGKGQMMTYWLKSRHDKTQSMAKKIEKVKQEVGEMTMIVGAGSKPPPPSVTTDVTTTKPKPAPPKPKTPAKPLAEAPVYKAPADEKRPQSGTYTPVTFDEVTRYTPSPSPQPSANELFTNPVISANEPLHQQVPPRVEIEEPSLEKTARSTALATVPPSGPLVQRGSSPHQCKNAQKHRMMANGDAKMWSSDAASAPTAGGVKGSCNCCHHCHMNHIKNLNDLVATQQAMLKETSIRAGAGGLLHVLPQVRESPYGGLGTPVHIKSHTCDIL